MSPTRQQSRSETDEVTPGGLQFGILGPLQVLDRGRPLDLGPRKQQLVLALLLCHANSRVTVDTLIESLWKDRPPRTARKSLQVYVSGLRTLLPATPPHRRITHWADGYVLSVDDGALDWLRFEERVRAGLRLGAPGRSAAVAQVLNEALALWRGPVLDGMRGTAVIDEAAQQLEGRFLGVFEDWAEAQLVAGVSLDVVERITALAQRHPFRERLRMAQMTALNQIGRRTEALAVFDDLRRSLASEFGLSPSLALTELYQALLRDQEPPARREEHILRRPVTGCLLPRDTCAFTGRESEMQDLKDALVGGGERLAVIAGPVGVGKTTLAIHAAHKLRKRFPDGCYFVRLRRDDGVLRPLTDITSELMWAAGHPGAVENAGTMAMWQRWLAGHRALIVLDNARGEPEVRPLLPEIGESAVIVTARTRLVGLGGAHRLTLSPFSTAEAMDLLRRIIGDRRLCGDQPSAERILTAVGRLPLAVRVIGDKLAGLDHVPLSEYLMRMETAPSLLDELIVGDVAVRARVAGAIADLTPAADSAFRRLGALPRGGFTLREAAEALGAAEEMTLRTLESLLEASVITAPDAETVAHDVVYELPPLIQTYACELAGSQGDRVLR